MSNILAIGIAYGRDKFELCGDMETDLKVAWSIASQPNIAAGFHLSEDERFRLGVGLVMEKLDAAHEGDEYDKLKRSIGALQNLMTSISTGVVFDQKSFDGTYPLIKWYTKYQDA